MDLFPYLNVLVVDDDPLFCLLTDETLRTLGFRTIYTACSSAAGARILDHHSPALVLVDVDRLRQDFWSALADGSHRETLVIATSFDREDRNRRSGRQPDAFLAKPYSKSQLFRTISHLLAGRAGRRCRIVPLKRMDQAGRLGPDPALGRKDRGDSSA